MSYIDNWMHVLNQIDDDNTYKALWGRAIIECIEEQLIEKQGDDIILLEYDIVKKLIKYYWNLYAYYGLNAHANKRVLSRLKKIQTLFNDQRLTHQKVWYDQIDRFFQLYPQLQEQVIKQFMTLTNKGYAHQFLHVHKDKYNLYELDVEQKLLRFSRHNIRRIKHHKETLKGLIHYRLGLVLSSHHKSSNILQKINNSMRNTPKKYNTARILKVLIEYHHLRGIKDFYTGESLSTQDATMKPVFPAWFLESDLIWNWVTVSKSTLKKDHKVTPKLIEQLKTRNAKLLEQLSHTNLQYKKDLLFEKNHHLIDRYALDFSGGHYDL